MDFKSKNTNWLTPLLRWISGEATRRDEQSLERAAQDDPFLADALDGYRSLPEGDHAAAVTRLKANLRRRSQQRRGIGFYLLRAAAVGAVLVGAWAVYSQFDQNETSLAGRSEAAQQTAPVPAPPVAFKTETLEDDASAEEKISSGPTFLKRKTETADALSPNDGPAVVGPEPPPSPAALQATEAFSEPSTTAIDNAPRLAEAGEVSPPSKERAVTSEMARSKKSDNENPTGANALAAPQMPVSPTRKITGQVTDEAGNPLIGVAVLAKGTSTGAMTDLDGGYSIHVPASATTLQFSYVGYASLEIELGGAGRLDVKLSESGEMLSEVVVTELGKGRDRQVAPPAPKGGFKKFEKYIQKNLRRPDAGAAVPVSGRVTVQFRILPNGSLTDFQPTGPLGQEFKDEAVRLLREGPSWEGVPDSIATYTIHF